MKLPRDVSGIQLAKALASLGYRVDLRIGTLAAILGDVGAHHGLPREALVEKLFGR